MESDNTKQYTVLLLCIFYFSEKYLVAATPEIKGNLVY